MTDLDDLKALMDEATPQPDPAKRLENLRLAQENFEALQGSPTQPRPTSSNPIWTGAKTMFDKLTSRGGLTVTTAIVACGFLVWTPAGQEILGIASKADAPAPEVPSTVTVAPTDAEIITQEQVLERVEPDAIPSNNPADPTPMVEEAAEMDMAAPAPTTQAQGGIAMSADAVIGYNDSTAPSSPPAGDAPEAPRGQRFSPASPSVLFDGDSGTDGYGVEAEQDLQAQIQVLVDELQRLPDPNTETFANDTPNPLKITAEEPVSTFSIDVDTASYSVIRSSIMRGQLPPPDAVRIEEMVNYFPYDYAAPDVGEAPFRPTVQVFETPWNSNTQLVHIGIQGTLPTVEDRPPLNLVFLIDTSGSMDAPEKLPLLRQSFRLMLDNLRPEDQVAIVAYAGSAGQVLEPTPASDRQTILNALNNLRAGGSTNGQGGLEQAYAVADAMAEEGEISRVILATDGDFNVGLSDPRGLEDYIADKRDSGTYLSVLGFGRGNLQDATMQALAQNGNGTAAYIDTLSEAQKVLVDQLTGALFPIANDVKIQVEFNPAQIAEYRLIGYETRALNREDFNNDRVDAGELGAGHSVTAIYEVTPVGSPAQMTDPLRYGETQVASDSDELGFLRLRYKAPGEDVSQLIEQPFSTTGTPGTEAQFAAAIAGFGQLLRDDSYLGDWGWDEAIALATANRGDDPFGYRQEAVQLMRLAESLAN